MIQLLYYSYKGREFITIASLTTDETFIGKILASSRGGQQVFVVSVRIYRMIKPEIHQRPSMLLASLIGNIIILLYVYFYKQFIDDNLNDAGVGLVMLWGTKLELKKIQKKSDDEFLREIRSNTFIRHYPNYYYWVNQ